MGSARTSTGASAGGGVCALTVPMTVSGVEGAHADSAWLAGAGSKKRGKKRSATADSSELGRNSKLVAGF